MKPSTSPLLLLIYTAFIVSMLSLSACMHDDDEDDDDDEHTSTPLTVKEQVDSSADLSVVVLGSGGPVATSTGRAGAGYLILVGGTPRILMDMGGGTFQRLAETGYNIKDLDIILLSHLHIDHTADLSAAIKTIYFHNTQAINAANAAGETPPAQRADTLPIRIFGPGNTNSGAFPNGDMEQQYPSSTEYLDGHYARPTGVERYLHAFAGAIGAGTFAYTATDINSDSTSYTETTIVNDNDGLVVKAVGVNHGPVPAVAFRIEYNGKSIVYSGDTTSNTTNMETLAAQTDLLIYDTAIMDADFPPNPVFYNLHTKPTRMGEVAQTAAAKKLILSHITPATEPRIADVKTLITDAGFTGVIEAADDLSVYNIK